MNRITALALVLLVALPATASAATIVAHEDEKYFYRDGRMEKFEGQFENTYLLDLGKDTLIRTRVYDYQTKKITPDETVYQIQKDLSSHPANSARFGLAPFLRAVGHPNADTVEILIIKDDFVQSVQATADNIVVSRSRRLK